MDYNNGRSLPKESKQSQSNQPNGNPAWTMTNPIRTSPNNNDPTISTNMTTFQPNQPKPNRLAVECGTAGAPTCRCYQEIYRSTPPKEKSTLHSSQSNDILTMANALQGQYCMLSKIQQCMHRMEKENCSNYEHMVQIMKEIQSVSELYNRNKGIFKEGAESVEYRTADKCNQDNYCRRITHELDLKRKLAMSSRFGSSIQIIPDYYYAPTGSNCPSPKDTDTNSRQEDFDERSVIVGYQEDHVGAICPSMCPKCLNTMKVLMQEIEDLRRAKDFLFRIRLEANCILESAVAGALAAYSASMR